MNAPISWTRRIQNVSKNQNLYPHQSRITLPTLLWDTLYSAPQFHSDERMYQRFITVECKRSKQMVQNVRLFESPILKLERLDAILGAYYANVFFHSIRVLTNNKDWYFVSDLLWEIIVLEPVCCKKRPKKSKPRNWFGGIWAIWRFWMIPNWS